MDGKGRTSAATHQSTPTFVRMDPYVLGDNFSSYRELANDFFTLYNIEERLRSTYLVTSIGSSTYDKLRTLVHPQKPSDMHVEDIFDVLENYFAPKVNVHAERHRFNSAKQQMGESVTDFTIRLRSLAKKCYFGKFIPNDLTTVTANGLRRMAYQEALTDRLIAGIADRSTQQHLLRRGDLTWETATKIATTHERSTEQPQQMTATDHSVAIDYYQSDRHRTTKRFDQKGKPQRRHSGSMERNRSHSRGRSMERNRSHSRGPGTPEQPQPSRSPTKQSTCYRCGRSGASHTFSKCPARFMRCKRCDRMGHIASQCQNDLNAMKPIAKTIGTIRRSEPPH